MSGSWKNQIRKAGPKRPGQLRVFMPKASAQGVSPKKWAAWKGCGLSSFQRDDALQRFLSMEGVEPISPEPTPSHRPWASATGATPRQTTDGRGCQPRPNWNCNGGLRSGIRRPQSPSSIVRGAPQGGSWYPSAACRSPLRMLLRRGRLGYPRLRCDLLRIGFRLRQGGIASRVRLLSYVTQRDHFG